MFAKIITQLHMIIQGGIPFNQSFIIKSLKPYLQRKGMKIVQLI